MVPGNQRRSERGEGSDGSRCPGRGVQPPALSAAASSRGGFSPPPRGENAVVRRRKLASPGNGSGALLKNA